MKAFLAGIFASLAEKYINRFVGFIANEIKEVNQVRRDKKFLKELRKEKNAHERAKRIKHYIDSK